MKQFPALLGLFLFTLAATGLRAEGVWKVPVEAFQCIRENADSYLSASKEPIIIVVAACPVVDVADALSSTAQNSGLLKVGGGDSVLILTREELRCLVTTAPEENQDGYVSILKDDTCDQS
jgi:hypothetical protein